MKDSVRSLRKEVKGYLNEWMGGDEALIQKELKIFDSIVSRRDFLKTTSLATLALMVNQGCQDGAPSQWEGGGSKDLGAIPPIDAKALNVPANIAVDADMHRSFITHNPLPAYGSSDASNLHDHAILESFNPHIITVESEDELSALGYSKPDRTYGVAEHIHLFKEDGGDYALDIYEKSNDAHHGLIERKVKLTGTASQSYNRLVATNGSFHNRVADKKAYSQKMALLANLSTESVAFDDSSHIPLRLYYQTMANALLEPGVAFEKSADWEFIDLLKEFREAESHNFEQYEVVEVASYHDGHHHSFIYGTLRFDSFYSYGFVVSFGAHNDIKPAVTFFCSGVYEPKSG